MAKKRKTIKGSTVIYKTLNWKRKTELHAPYYKGDCRCRDRMIYNYLCDFESRSWRGVLAITLCDKVCQWLVIGWWFSPGTPVLTPIKLIATI